MDRSLGKTVKRWAPAVVIGLVCGWLGWWAGHEATAAQGPVAARQVAYTLAEAREQVVGRSLAYGVTVSQKSRPLAHNALGGVVTSVNPGVRDQGDTIYTVAGVPVRVVEGAMPFYRDLAAGVRGPDVLQLERALAHLDLLDGTPDTTFDWRTGIAVRRWQKQLRIPQTGSVALGEVVAVPALPASLALGEDIVVGAVLTSGEPSVLGSAGERVFALELSPEQARLVPSDAKITVQYKTRQWDARVADTTVGEGTTKLILRAPDGAPVCGSQCSELPTQPTMTLSSKVFVVPEAKGPAVPAAAVQSGADGSTFVVDEQGQRKAVVVKGAGTGLVVLGGIKAGEKVRMFTASGASSGAAGAGMTDAVGGATQSTPAP